MAQAKKVLPAKVTARWLRAFGACDDAVNTFAELWPRGIGRVTIRHVRCAFTMRLSVWWLLSMVCDRTPLEESCECAANESRAAEIAKYLRDHQKVSRA